jgi:serralysin
MDDSHRRKVRACIDRKVVPKPGNERMALVRASLWPHRHNIRVAFLDGDSSLHERVRKAALTWLDYANLSLYFVTAVNQADIRISFRQPGSWSYIGTECRSIPADQATMNYGWLTLESPTDEVARVVLHEFGHALGCIHEHQNPVGGIRWNRAEVYEYYGGAPNNWSEADIDRNILQAYDEDLTVHSQVDPESIMMYPIPRSLTLDGFEVDLNTQLSLTDKEFIRKAYP